MRQKWPHHAAVMFEARILMLQVPASAPSLLCLRIPPMDIPQHDPSLKTPRRILCLLCESSEWMGTFNPVLLVVASWRNQNKQQI